MTGDQGGIPRRDFLAKAWAGVGALAALGAGYVGLSFLASRAGAGESGGVVSAGAVDDFPPGTVTAITAGKFYLVRGGDGGFVALHQKCTHLACAVLWRAADGEFFCPCHASRFRVDGTVVNRPATSPLTRFRVMFDGATVLVDTSAQVDAEGAPAAYPGAEAAP